MMGQKPDVPYLIGDMAADAIGLLDALGIEKAHIMGASMGGMIAQIVAATYPDRVLSLTSIMSNTGNPTLPPATPEAMAVLTQRPTSNDMEALVAHGVRAEKVIGSPGYPVPEAELSARIRRDFQRSFYPAGVARQMAAIVGSGDRREALRTITAPTMVIHGVDDPLVPIAGGRDTAATISGAKIVEIPGMGHNLPDALIAPVLDAFEEVAKAGAPVD
jgi:pimeloyl-ACP methyl ester carboxylesterase